MKKLFCVVSLTFGHPVIAEQPQVAQSSPLPWEVEVVSVEQQRWYEAEVWAPFWRPEGLIFDRDGPNSPLSR